MQRQPTQRRSPYLEVLLQHIDLARGDTTVLKDVAWRIRPGERWVLVGGNGAGKTQLLKLVAGDVWPTPGGRTRRSYLWRGETHTQALGVKEEIAYLGPERQDRYGRYDWNFTAEQIVGTGLHRTDIPLEALTGPQIRRVAGLLKRLHISHLAQRRFLTLSYGERRLVLVARALAWRPALLLLDEVANGLDVTHRQRLLAFLNSTRRSTMPWVLTTHRAEDVPASATHLAIIRQGRLIYRGRRSPAALRRAFAAEADKPKAPRPAARAHARPRGAELVSLKAADVYVDGHLILAGLNFSIRQGECWVVHGGNGAGKSTLLRTVYGDHPVAVGGSIHRAGIEPGVPLSEFRSWVGYVTPQLQTDHPQYLCVTDAVGSGLHSSIGLNDALDRGERRRALAALKDFGLEAYAQRSLKQLSYGQLRRVLFARAWITRPRLLLLDEPFSGVDTPTRKVLLAAIEQLLERGLTLLIATHHRSEWPRGATHELELAGGRMRYCGAVRS